MPEAERHSPATGQGATPSRDPLPPGASRDGDRPPGPRVPPSRPRGKRSGPLGVGFRGHRPRTGKRSREHVAGGFASPLEGSNAAADPTVPPPAQKPRKEAKLHSSFSQLRSSLSEATAVAEYIRTFQEKSFGEPRQVNAFLQAISNRPEVLYESLMGSHRAEVAVLLERLLALYSLGKTKMSPCAHEFLIRCQLHGIQQPEWATGIRPLEGVEPSLFTPSDLLRRLVAVDVMGHVRRRIEMCRDATDLLSCARELRRVLGRSTDAADVPEDEEEATTTTTTAYASRCQLISKILSKARRLMGSKVSVAQPSTTEDPSAEGDEGDEGEEAPQASGQEAETPPDVPRPLTPEERKAFRRSIVITLRVLDETIRERPSGTTLQPISKVIHLTKWCVEHGLLEEADLAHVEYLEAQMNADVERQASQLETVLQLKALPKGDGEALRAVVDALWETGGHTYLTPYSPDVLSSIATASSAEGISSDLKQLIAHRLIRTVVERKEEDVQLPRRVLRFVNAEQNKVKQAAIRRELEGYDASEGHTARLPDNALLTDA